MQVTLYARVSTSQQEKTDSVESQDETLHAYTAVYDYTVFSEHIFLHNGVSARPLTPKLLTGCCWYSRNIKL